MHPARMTSALRFSTILLALALACGDGDGKTGASDGSTGDATQGGSTTDASTGTTTSATASTTDDPTTAGTGSATGTTGDDPTGTTGDDPTGTTGEPVEFERFRISRAAGPCPPNADCDGFIELVAPGTLRVEKFGAVGNPVDETMITPFEFSVAVKAFADPELLALLDGPEPLCDPPTDIFESMLSVVDGVEHEATTTACDQPPLVNAREMAQSLVDMYFP
jgi:hypothetical protein